MVGDMIVNLYQKDVWRTSQKWDIRRIFPSDKDRLMAFVKQTFPNETGWLLEIEYAWSHGNIYIAVDNNQSIVGFACYNCSGKGYFGPFGVAQHHRRMGIGEELFCSCMDALKHDGYGYAIIGWVADSESDDNSPVGFYKKVANASFIPDSRPDKTIYSNKSVLKRANRHP